MSSVMVSESTINEDIVREISNKLKEPSWILEKRLEAFSKISTSNIKNFVYGLGINVDTGDFSLKNLDYTGHNKPFEIQHSDGVIVSNLHKAMETHEEIIKKHLLSTVDISNNLSAVHSALWSRGLFVYVPAGVEATMPISYLSTTSNDALLENILVVAEPFSKLTLVEVSDSIPNQPLSFKSQVLEIFSKESSKVDFCCIQNSGENVFNVSDRKAVMCKDSSIGWIVCDIGGCVTKSDVTTSLDGEGSSVKNIGLFLGRGKQQFDFSVTAVHRSPNTFSDMLTKGALSGRAKAVYRGYIKIKDSAPKSSGYQKADILLLSKDAEADPIPNLEIDNNDIEKCTHGATVGQIDREKLFYMMSRGLSEKDATKQIVAGLFSPAMNRIGSDSIKKKLDEILEKKMEDL